MRPVLLLIAVVSLPLAAASTQDASTYPDGVTRVEHSDVEAAKDFSVTVEATGADHAEFAVCSFKTKESATPYVCYFNRAMVATEGGFTASSSAFRWPDGHPPWKDGWSVGYKVTLAGAGGERHIPDRFVPDGDPDYYRLVVGEKSGSVELEDEPTQDGSAASATTTATGAAGTQGSGKAPVPILPLLAILLLGLARLRA